MWERSVKALSTDTGFDSCKGIPTAPNHYLAKEPFVPELLEDRLCCEKLLVAEGAKVQDRKGVSGADGHPRFARLLTAGVPPIRQQAQSAVTPHGKSVVESLVRKINIGPYSAADALLLGE